MTDPQTQRNPVEEMAEEFLERYRRGERPALTEYIRKHPELSDKIRELFPALVMLEEVGPQEAGPSGACSGRMTADGQALERLGDYRILREVARGGMGVVYEAEQEALGRHVALKVLPYQSPIDPVRLQRFRRESRSAARLHHTNIVPVFDVGEYQGTYYYAMQFIRGQALDEVLTELKHMRGVKDDAKATGLADDPARTPIRQLTVSLARGLLTGEFSRKSLAEEDAAVSRPAVSRPEPAAPEVAETKCDSPLERMDNPSSASGATSNILKNRSDLFSSGDLHYFRSAAQIGLQVAEALAYAHSQKVLHRDIKPANLLLDFQGTVWVTDFGLAKEEGEDLTQTGDLVGTLRYMAPERFNGESDPRSDIYGLGLTLYELLTLRPAFEESDRSRLIKRIADEDPLRPRKRHPQIPRDLETIVLKAIAKDPRQRYQVAEEMAEDLRRFLADRPIQARRSAVWEHAWRWCRRNRLLATLSAAVFALVVALGVGFLVANLLWTERDRALASQKRAEDAEGRARAAEQENKVREHLARAAAYRRSGRVGQRFKALAELTAAVKFEPAPELRRELRNEAIACLVLPDVEVAKEWDGYPAGTDQVQFVEFDASLTHYARPDLQGNVSILRVKDDQKITSIPGEGKRVGLRFSADGQYLAVLVTYQPTAPLKVWQLGGPEPKLVVDEPDNAGWAFDFAPDSRQIIIGLRDIGRRDGGIRIYDLPAGKLSRPLNAAPFGTHDRVKLHPKDPVLAMVRKTGKSVQLLHLQTGQTLPELPHPHGLSNIGGLPDLAWHPDGKSLAVSCADMKIYVWDVPARKQTVVLESPIGGGSQLTFNHAGTLLASNDWNGILRLWDTRTGRQVFNTPAVNSLLRFSPDDRLLAAEVKGSKLRLLRIADGREFRTLPCLTVPGGHYHPLSQALAPEGRLLAATIFGNDSFHGIALLDLATGSQLAFLPIGYSLPVRFDGDAGLMTCGQNGLLEWPLQRSGMPGLLRYGPPRTLLPRGEADIIGLSADGRLLALPRYQRGALLVQRDHPAKFTELTPQEDVRFCAISTDGRWVATGSHDSQKVFVKVWDGPTGKLVKDLPVHGSSLVGFSPDGRWLATTGGGCRLWVVGSWEEGPKISGDRFAFAPDSKVLAVGDGFGVVHLYDPNTGAEYARLEVGSQVRPIPQCFTPDGAQLITGNVEEGTIQIWNLRAIREQLADMGLDWDLPAYPPPKNADATPLKVEVDMGDLGMTPEQQRSWQRQAGINSLLLALNPWNFQARLARATAWSRLGDHARAFDDYNQALLLLPSEKWDPVSVEGAALEFNYWAWLWARYPPKSNEGPRALALARKAVSLQPGQWQYRNTLGVVYYRLGDYPNARANLEQSLQDSAGETAAFDLFFLAMCYQRTGDAAKARDCYDRAQRWLAEHRTTLAPAWADELKEIRREAAAVLKVSEP
jgi:serine/threonine protein kinase/WD40 repeat protein/Tfp pilus assembly protein PilF